MVHTLCRAPSWLATRARLPDAPACPSDIVVPDVLTPEEVAAANAVVDANYEKTAVAAQHMKGQAAVPDGSAVGDQDRWDLRGMLGWPDAEREPFQRMLGHPKLTRYLNDICGKGFRMDHAPTLITQMTGSPSGGCVPTFGTSATVMSFGWVTREASEGLNSLSSISQRRSDCRLFNGWQRS